MSTDSSLDDISIAVAHWHVRAWGGAEYLVTKLAEALGKDTVYTMAPPSPEEPNPYGEVEFVDVLPSLSPTPLRRFQSRVGRVFEYTLWEDVDWREFGHPDVLVTSGSTTRAVITPDDVLHLNYCHSPPRWFYDLYHDRKDSLLGLAGRPLVRYLRMRDMSIDPRVDHYFVNSPVVARRLETYYNRDSEVLYPPVDLDACYDGGDDGYYLHLGRLDEEKGVPAIIEAFRGTDHELVLAGGEGDIDEAVRRQIDKAQNIDYRGFVAEAEKFELLAHCRALVFNGRNEDFGIVPIEANASGKAVLARNEGFPAQYIVDGRNGYKHDGSADGIRSGVERFENERVVMDPAETVAEFGFGHFREQLRNSIEAQLSSFRLAG